MARAKKQHYVPQFLLRNFASGPRKTAKVWVLDKKTAKVRRSSVRDVAHENQFYEYTSPDGSKMEIERLMQELDSRGAPAIQRIVDSGSLDLLDTDAVWLSYFVACQILRTPMIRNDMENIRQMFIHKWGPHIRASSEDPRTLGEYGPEDARLSSLQIVENVPDFATILQQKVWVLSCAPDGSPFVISDNPVTRHNLIPRGGRGNLGLNNDGIEIHMPVSPRYALHIICPKLAELTFQLPDCAAYIEALSSGLPVPLKPENVEFDNSLQVQWAERFVIAKHREDLAMPLDMLRTNPELREGPGVRQRPEDA